MRVLGWVGIAAGTLLVIAGFALLTFTHFPSETSVWNASPGRWDDYLLVLACLGAGAVLARAGDRTAGWPIMARFGALGDVRPFERQQRIWGCMTFFVGLGLLALVLFMAAGTVWTGNNSRGWGALIVGFWALPILLVMRSGWRRFSGRTWFFGGASRE